MRGPFPSGPPPTNNIPSSSSTRSPIFEVGECRGHSEGAKRENETLGSCSRHLLLCSCPAVGSRERAGNEPHRNRQSVFVCLAVIKGTGYPFSLWYPFSLRGRERGIS